MAETTDYYGDKKWCRRCRRNVRYLMSVNYSYCIHCGNVVTLFSEERRRRFNRELTAMKEARRGAMAC